MGWGWATGSGRGPVMGWGWATGSMGWWVGWGSAMGSGDGVGSGGAAVTTAVGVDRASSEPCSLVTLTRARSREPTSSPVSVRWLEVAPEIDVQGPCSGHRSHCHRTIGSGSPVHVAVAVSVRPSCASPEITGWLTVGGAGAARPRAGTTSAATESASSTDTTTMLERFRTRIPTIARSNMARPGKRSGRRSYPIGQGGPFPDAAGMPLPGPADSSREAE